MHTGKKRIEKKTRKRVKCSHPEGGGYWLVCSKSMEVHMWASERIVGASAIFIFCCHLQLFLFVSWLVQRTLRTHASPTHFHSITNTCAFNSLHTLKSNPIQSEMYYPTEPDPKLKTNSNSGWLKLISMTWIDKSIWFDRVLFSGFKTNSTR